MHSTLLYFSMCVLNCDVLFSTVVCVESASSDPLRGLLSISQRKVEAYMSLKVKDWEGVTGHGYHEMTTKVGREERV